MFNELVVDHVAIEPQQLPQDVLSIWASYTPAPADNAILMRFEGIADVCKIAPPDEYIRETNVQDWLVLPLHDAHKRLTGLAYLSPEIDGRPIYYSDLPKDNGYHPQGGVLLNMQHIAHGQPVYVVSDPTAGFMLARAGLSVVVSLTPEQWRGVNPKDHAMNLFLQANLWDAAGYPVIVPVESKDLKNYQKWMDKTGATVIGIEGMNAPSLYEPPELADLIKTAMQATADTWPEPEPLTDPDHQAPYPIHALPADLQALVKELEDYYRAPVPMIATCALSILSSAGQALADVDIDGTLKKPLSLFTLIVAESGERKSEIDKVLSKPLHEWERQQLEDRAEEIKAARAAYKAWEAAKRGIEKRIETLASKGQDYSEAEEKLAELEANPPQAVLIPDLIMQDQTPEGMAKALKRYPSICLLSSEAAVVLGGHGMGKDSASRNQGMMNDLWSGQPIKITRAAAESFSLHGRRLSAGLAVQQSVLSAFAKDGAARGIGFFARFLITQPDSTKGTRFYESPPDWRHLSAWRDRIHALLNTPLQIDPDNALQPHLLQLAPDAQQLWIDGYNAIERELGQFGEFADVGDVASKSADNAARIAGLLHLYQHGLVGRVTADEMRCGLALALWHLNESKRYFTKAKTDEKTLLAARLEQWLMTYCIEQQTDHVPRAYVLQHCPIRALRKAAALDDMIKTLGATRCRLDNRNGKQALLINPAILKTAKGC
jgi:putative DNA primase/helicase